MKQMNRRNKFILNYQKHIEKHIIKIAKVCWCVYLCYLNNIHTHKTQGYLEEELSKTTWMMWEDFIDSPRGMEDLNKWEDTSGKKASVL